MQENTLQPLSPEDERIAKLIVDSAFAVHKTLGPGLLENIYEPCFVMNLENVVWNIKGKLLCHWFMME